jgi:hypothetical protein
MTTSHRLLLVGLVAVLAVSLTACAGGAASLAPGESETPSAAAPATDAPPASRDPDGTDDGEPSDPGEVVTSPPDAGNGNFPPGGPGGPGQPEFVQPQPGQQMVRPVGITELIARVSGNRVELNAKWSSGVEPCSVLDSIEVAREGTTFTISLFEGTSDPDAMCIAVAVEKVTLVDLGELASGTYTVRASMGDAPDITVEVP